MATDAGVRSCNLLVPPVCIQSDRADIGNDFVVFHITDYFMIKLKKRSVV